MKLVLLIASLIACLMPWRFVSGQEMSGQALLDALVARTPGATLNRMRNRPEAFVEEAAGLILGYGGPQGLSAADIETAINAERARLRAREIRRVLDADLNGDLSVTRRELNVVLSAASATMRGRLLVWHRAADKDDDGTATWPEIRKFASQSAQTHMTDQAAAAMRAMMTFDLDGDGFVMLQEVLDAMHILGAPA
ncbi:MAG: hypothetical protein AB3N17_18600 [Tateyamaria sp.]